MSAYIIAFVDVHNRPRYTQEYVPAIIDTLEPYGGRILASSDEARILEGVVPPGRIVIIEFPDLDHAQSWHASDAYAPLLSLRKSIATTSLVALPGVFMAQD